MAMQTTGSGSYTMGNANQGLYTLTGRHVLLNGYFNTVGWSTTSGDFRVAGLPFTSYNGNPGGAAVTMWFNGIGSGQQGLLEMEITQNGTNMYAYYGSGANVVSVNQNYLDSSFDLRMAATYPVQH